MKSGRLFSVPLHRDVTQVLTDLRARRARHAGRFPRPDERVIRVNATSLRRLLGRTLARAGLSYQRLRWHDLRYTYAAWLARLAPELIVRQLLDHAPATITQRYAQHFSAKDLRQWVEQLPSVLPRQRQLDLWQQA